ncbi:MAG: hypothetical protein M5T61_21315 [Acidimicrobiia bacterium]|nr:hypothetical protein [Acidimicrobiia bacterium]
MPASLWLTLIAVFIVISHIFGDVAELTRQVSDGTLDANDGRADCPTIASIISSQGSWSEHLQTARVDPTWPPPRGPPAPGRQRNASTRGACLQRLSSASSLRSPTPPRSGP